MALLDPQSDGTIKDAKAVFHENDPVSSRAEATMKASKLTAKQRETLEAIRAHVKRHGVGPTRLELCEALGVKHQGSIEARLQGLAKRGWVELVPFVERGIRLLREGTPVLDPELVPAVSAGTPILAEEYGAVVRAPDFESGWSPFEAKPEFFVRVRGDSLDRAGFTDGDVVAVRRDPEPKEGDLVVARIGQEVTLKRYHRESETVIELQPMSTNPDFAIAGVVVGAMVGARHHESAD